MKLRRTLPALTIAVLPALALAACTSGQETDPETEQPVALSLVTETSETYQALTAIYASQLEARGYEITVLDPVDDPSAQVADGKADLAITGAGQAARALQSQGQGSASSDAALTRDESAQLISQAAGDSFRALDASPGDLGWTLVMSRAEISLESVEDLNQVAQKCEDVRFAAPAAAAAALREGLEAAGCASPAVQDEEPAKLAGDLRTANVDAVVLSQADAVISDEGFVPVQGAAALFDSEPVLPLAGTSVLESKANNVVNEVTRALDQEALIAVDRMIHGAEAYTPQQVAQRWKWLAQ